MNKLSVLFFVFLLSFNVFSATKTWDGGGADANWNTPANWSTDVAPVANDDLIFPAASAQFATNNNLAGFTTFNSLTIEGGNYTIGGNGFRLSNGLTVNGGTQIITTSINVAGTQTYTAALGSTTTIVLLNMSGSPLTFDGAGSFGIGVITEPGILSKTARARHCLPKPRFIAAQFLSITGFLSLTRTFRTVRLR